MMKKKVSFTPCDTGTYFCWMLIYVFLLLGVWTEMVGTETKCIALVNQIDLIHYINSLSLSKQAKLAQMRLGDVIEWQSFDRDISVPIRASLFKLMW